MQAPDHYSVLLKESVDALVQRPNGFYIDGTFGRGGHSREILSRLAPNGHLLGLDKDPEAISVAETLAQTDARFRYQHASFARFPEFLGAELPLDGVLLDLGVSSPQLDEARRGFSFMKDGPLDMRMDSSSGQTAEQWLASVDENTMTRVFRDFGEERFARRIARTIVEQRARESICSTGQLARLIEAAVPVKDKFKHPATRVFQAIRIEINQELQELQQALQQALRCLAPGGRLVVISFHSLEDRMVKRFMKQFAKSQDYPAGLPVTHDKLLAPLTIVGKAIQASAEEVDANVRSRSAVMRVAERTAN